MPNVGSAVEFAQGGVFTANAIQPFGKALNIESNAGNVLAWIVGEKNRKYPGILSAQYGLGKVLFFSFDLGLSIQEENFNNMLAIISQAETFVHKAQDFSQLYPYNILPLMIHTEAASGALDMQLNESYTA